MSPFFKGFANLMNHSELSFEKCETLNEGICMESPNIMAGIVKNNTELKDSHCNVTMYEGRIMKNKLNFGISAGVVAISSGPSRIIKEEYLVYSFFGMLGTAGGSFGLLVGFSFFDWFCMTYDFVIFHLTKLYNLSKNLNVGRNKH